mmetsp:Transcript_132524/g.342905  ORF Transcript_132524/g.342905 Transcript_132524/m.342905 type:complete len:173 (+) Transcript_132524:1-519(+)
MAMAASPGHSAIGAAAGAAELEHDEHELKDRESAVVVLSMLEDYCSSPEFLEGVQELIMEGAALVDDREDNFPLAWYECFQRYAQTVEQLLERFLEERGLELEEVARICEWLREEAPHTLFSIDYLLASLDFEAFVSLMLDWKELQGYNVEPGLPVGAAPELASDSDFDLGD